ncbi:MAG: hypothetical protein ACRDJC_14405 [Thermomicrobiales bacterium]
MKIHRVKPWKQWPSGDSRPIAVLAYDLADLAQRYGLTVQDGIDDLDRYRLAAIELTDGQQAWFTKHDGDPNPGTVVLVDSDVDVEKAQSLLGKALGLERDAFLWTAPIPASTR